MLGVLTLRFRRHIAAFLYLVFYGQWVAAAELPRNETAGDLARRSMEKAGIRLPILLAPEDARDWLPLPTKPRFCRSSRPNKGSSRLLLLAAANNISCSSTLSTGFCSELKLLMLLTLLRLSDLEASVTLIAAAAATLVLMWHSGSAPTQSCSASTASAQGPGLPSSAAQSASSMPPASLLAAVMAADLATVAVVATACVSTGSRR